MTMKTRSIKQCFLDFRVVPTITLSLALQLLSSRSILMLLRQIWVLAVKIDADSDSRTNCPLFPKSGISPAILQMF